MYLSSIIFHSILSTRLRESNNHKKPFAAVWAFCHGRGNRSNENLRRWQEATDEQGGFLVSRSLKLLFPPSFEMMIGRIGKQKHFYYHLFRYVVFITISHGVDFKTLQNLN